MIKKILLIPLFLILIVNCSGIQQVKTIDRKDRYVEMSISFNTEHYPWILKTKYPQLAVWIKTQSNNVKTLFVTKRSGKNDWLFADERPSSLPVWFGIQSKEKNMEIDAISGATPSGEVHTIHWKIPESYNGKEITVFLESNISFDYNDFYTKEENNPGYSDVNGQPSIVWSSTFTVDDKSKNFSPEIIGHGHVLGKNHEVDPDISNITTAIKLFNYINLEYNPGE